MKIKCHIFHDNKDIYVLDKEHIKAWLIEKRWEALHEFTNNDKDLSNGDHIPMDEVFIKIDESDRVIYSAGEVRENHRLGVYFPTKSFVYWIGEINILDLDEEKIAKPKCKKCGEIRKRGAHVGGCAPKEGEFYPEHEWDKDFED